MSGINTALKIIGYMIGFKQTNKQDPSICYLYKKLISELKAHTHFKWMMEIIFYADRNEKKHGISIFILVKK